MKLEEIAKKFAGVYCDDDDVDEPCVMFSTHEHTLECIKYLLANGYDFIVTTQDDEDTAIVLL